MKTIDIAQELADRKQINALLGKERLFISKGCMHWSEMTGKMYGKRAIGRPMTSRCIENQKIDGCICQKCYATTINKVYPAMGKALQRNRDVKLEHIKVCAPLFTDMDPTWRSNWNGDYEDMYDVLVDWAICESSPQYTCTAWTKQIDVLEHMILDLGLKKPANYTLMQSSPMINQRQKRSKVADQVFTIYTAEHAAEHNIQINCIGACRLCKRCYGNDLKARPKVINELLKGQEAIYFELMGL